MSLTEQLLRLIEPDRERWRPMLAGLAVFAAGAAAAVALQPSPLSVVALVVAVAAWIAGACAMVGYVRWFLGAEAAQAREDARRQMDRRGGRPPAD